MSRKSVEFKLFAPDARTVYLAGDFNNWNTSNMKMKKNSKGMWMAKTDLLPGSHEYKFIVDGNWWTDPSCKSHATSSLGSQNSVVRL